MRSLKLFLVAAAVASGAMPAQAANVTVEFGLAAGTHAPTGALCPVSVPAGADGVAVLDAAVEEGCIVSYDTVTDPTFGAYVTCIDEVCQAPAEAMTITYWKLFIDGAAATQGVSFYEAGAGDELVFSYTTWAGCLVDDEDPALC